MAKAISPARRRAERQQRGKASDYISPIEELQPGTPVVLCCRVSHCNQGRKGHLEDQENNLRQILKSTGVRIVSVFKKVASGIDPSWVFDAVQIAEKYQAVLVAESTSRFIRHPGFHSKEEPDLQPRKSDLEKLRDWTSGISLFTALNPDASPEEEKSFQTNRGLEFNSKRGGRPRKKNPLRRARKEAYLPIVLEQHESGMSYRQIANSLNSKDDEFKEISYSAIGNWIRKHKEDNEI